MTLARLYVSPANVLGSVARLETAESHHLRHVLRLRVGDLLQLFDGLGGHYLASVTRLGARVELAILSRGESSVESPLHLVLCQSLLKGPKMDWVIQKCTELGTGEFVPVQSEFSEVDPDHASRLHRTERWDRIARAATAQCGRSRTPVIQQVIPLHEFLTGLADPEENEMRVVLCGKGGICGEQPLTAHRQSKVCALVGPEGGWSESEYKAFRDAGFQSVHLGPRTLRAETAAIVFVAVLQYLWGDLGRRHEAEL